MPQPLKAVLMFGFVFAASAQTRAQEACRLPDGAVGQLLDWIAVKTDYDIERVRIEPPAIESCATGAVIDYAHEATIVDAGIHGLYDFESRHIYLIEPWDYDDLRDRSVLLHELVHAVQLDNREWDCIGAPEWEAYKLQEAWLAEHGLEADFDWLQIYFQSRCPRDVHPD
jgi:hypothetical protein